MGKEKAEKIFHSKQVDAVILTSPANMRYMAGFCGEGYVYLSEKKHVFSDGFPLYHCCEKRKSRF